MLGLEESLYALNWNNNISVAIITLIFYEYMLQLKKEITFVWERQWSAMTYLYLVVRYFGILVAMYITLVVSSRMVHYMLNVTSRTCACWGGLFDIPEAVSYGMFLLMQWGFSVYFCLAEVILIWRLYALCNQSRRILYILLGFFLPIALYIAVDIFLWSQPSAVSMQEIIITPNVKYCTAVFYVGPMPAVYASIPIICYDLFLVVLAITVLGKHLKERKEIKMRPSAYVVTIVRYHVIYFVLNLATQIFMAILWANFPTVVMYLVQLFNGTALFIIVPRLIISIWDTHVDENCVHVSTTFEDCVCWTLPPLEQYEMD
ncbi:hypothetical protein BD769DRAFT_116367 [Suillus cothurnatus]|nr:hypothetical protein BD769DRAFT_116367 [Suillus cothurnatus]